MNDHDKKYTDFANVEKQRDFLTAEELPEGPFGSPIGKEVPVFNKSTPWREGQRHYSAFNYEFKTLHQDIPRQMGGPHPPHDDADSDKQPPYE